MILGLLASPLSRAADDSDGVRQFDIELLIFQNLVENDGGEVWPADYTGWYDDVTGDAAATTPTLAVDWLPESTWHLKAERAALNRSSRYRTLAYLAWRQPVYDRNNAQPLELPAQPRSNAAWVDGSVSVAVERYLHLNLDLQLHLPEATVMTGAAGPQDSGPEPRTPRIRLTEQRRMRSKELHYFDNPRFGVIAVITPVEQPAEPARTNATEEPQPESDEPKPAVTPQL
jgi:hypothetical protein